MQSYKQIVDKGRLKKTAKGMTSEAFFTYFLNSNLSIYTTINDKVTVCIKYWEKTCNFTKN